jgi:hypothetical protein
MIEMMDTALVAHRLAGSIPADFADAEQAPNVAMSLLDGVQSMIAPRR